jgi:hypothetical protein
MVRNTPVIMAMSVLATGAIAAVDYPPIPSDLTTPFQQRLAVYGPNGRPLDLVPPTRDLTNQLYQLDGTHTRNWTRAASSMARPVTR